MDGKQLRNSILQWAIQGKLVPQDPNDEPASVLLERIREEKARLVEEKKIKRDKNESIIYRGEDNSYYEKFVDGKVVCIDDELPYSLPLGWTWCRLNELGTYRKGPFGSSLTKSMFVPKSEHSIKVYEQKNAIQKDYRLGEYYISEDKFSEMQSFVTKPSNIIVSCAGTIGETYLLPEEAPIGIINQALMRVELYNLDMADYWQLFFAYILLIENKMKGAGSAIKNIPPFEYLKAILVPIPPLQEQKRIIEKFNKLTKLICQYTQQKEELDLLNDNLYPSIKKSILQEAIQGKLVNQNPDDEPASVLLERIKIEKERLIKEKKIKRDKQESIIYRGDDNKYYERRGKEVICIDDEIPFEIPNNWMWVRGRTAFLPMESTKPKGEQFVYIDVAAVNNKTNIIEGAKTIKSNNAPSRATRKLHLNDILFSMVRPYLRNIALVTNEYSNAIASTGYYVITPSVAYNPQFLFLLMMSPYVVDGLNQYMKGDNSPSINNADIEGFIFPLPPLCEQQRIVDAISVAWQVL